MIEVFKIARSSRSGCKRLVMIYIHARILEKNPGLFSFIIGMLFILIDRSCQ